MEGALQAESCGAVSNPNTLGMNKIQAGLLQNSLVPTVMFANASTQLSTCRSHGPEDSIMGLLNIFFQALWKFLQRKIDVLTRLSSNGR